MKTGGDKIEGEIDTLLDKIVMLFSYLSDKVIFAANRIRSDISLEKVLSDFQVDWAGYVRWILSETISETLITQQICFRRWRALSHYETQVSMWSTVHIQVRGNAHRYECFQRQSGNLQFYPSKNCDRRILDRSVQSNFSAWMRKSEVNLGIECSVTVSTASYWLESECCCCASWLTPKLRQVLTTGFWPTYKVDEVTRFVGWLRADFELGRAHGRWLWYIAGHFAAWVAEMCGHIHTLLWVEDIASEAEVDSYAGHIYCDWSLWSKANWVGVSDLNLYCRHQYWFLFQQVISTYQACILMLFNQQESYSTGDICRDTKLPMEELKKYLQTLALSKYQILTKSPNPKSKDISDTDVFTFNRSCNTQLALIKAGSLLQG